MRIPPIAVCWDDTSPYTPPFTHGRVIKVNTGHTVTLAAYQEGSEIPYRFSVRLRGVDCPRMGARSEGERRIATKAQSAVEGMILGSVVGLQAASFDHTGHGRILATVCTHTGLDLSDWLVGQRLGVCRDGSPVHPKCWLLYHETGNMHGHVNKHRCVVDMTSKLRTDCFFYVALCRT
jgi:hypothetical protein